MNNNSLLDFLLSGFMGRRSPPTRHNKKLSVGSDAPNPSYKTFGSHCCALVYSYENGTLEVNVYRKHDPEQIWRTTVQKEQFSFTEFVESLSSFDPATANLTIQPDHTIAMTLLQHPQDIAGVLYIANQCRIDSVIDRVAGLFTDLVKMGKASPPPPGPAGDPDSEGAK